MNAATELLRDSGQMGRFWIGAILILVGGLLLTSAGFVLGRVSNNTFFSLSILGITLGLAGFVYLCREIRCPSCGVRWFWLMASKRRDDPLHWGYGANGCTACDYRGGPPTSRFLEQ